MDWSYYSFAYTRLQEQDWAEIFFHEKRKHVDAVVGWMGYWYGAAGYRNPDAAWAPGMAYLTLDTDLEVAGLKPNLAFTMGAFWPRYGYFEKYDTYTLGRFRQMGEELKVTIPLDEDSTVTITEGVGTNRDGSYIYSGNPLYAGKTAIDMIAWLNLQYTYRKILNVSVHANHTFTRDPRLTGENGTDSGRGYVDAADARLSVAGAEAILTLPALGRLWVSPSIISVRQGWALAGAGGVEVMHAQNGNGLAWNYLGWTNDPPNNTGSGTMYNLGFQYENSVSNIRGTTPNTAPDLKFSVFGLLTNASFDLPEKSNFSQPKLKQIKYGADATLQALSWLSVMLRGDTVNYDMDHGGYIFSAITGRLSIYTDILSGESVYLQFSHYIYGDHMKLAGRWSWNTPLVTGADVIQSAGGYMGQKPDANVIKLQANVAF
jgi:hypothetical protein